MKKLLTFVMLLTTLLTLSTGTVFAQTATPITGTVDSVVTQTDATTGETIVVVTLTDDMGTSHTVNLSLATAESLGLVTVDATTGEITVNEVTDLITINPEDILPPSEGDTGDEEAQHPVGSALSEFFGELLGMDYETIMTAHEDGVGFGVIAQALWLTNELDGSSEDFQALIDAKQSGDYSNITLADGSTPDNWGDVVKSLKKGDNLGSVKSGHADNGSDSSTDTQTDTQQQSTKEHGNGGGNGNGQGKGNNDDGQGKGNGNGKSEGKGEGKGGGGGNGHGKP